MVDYNVSGFGGSKSIVLAQIHPIIGAKNGVLGIGYIVVGSASLLCFVVFALAQCFGCSRKPGEVAHL